MTSDVHHYDALPTELWSLVGSMLRVESVPVNFPYTCLMLCLHETRLRQVL